MARTRSYENTDGVGSTGIVEMDPSDEDANIKKIPVQGWDFIALTTIEDGNASITAEAKGTNNNDTSDSNGETLITNSHSGNDQQDGRARVTGYRYVFIDITSVAGGSENLSKILLELAA